MPSDVPSTRYYSVCISNSASRARGTPWVWSAPFATAAEATQHGLGRLDRGEVTLAFVVEAVGDQRRVLLGRTRPQSAKKIIAHYLDLLALVAWPVE